MADRAYASWLDPDRFIRSRYVRPVLEFARIESSSGIIMLIAAVVALVWANSPAWESYFHLWEAHFTFEFGPIHLEETLHEVINDGLMAIFFFVVGLEIKRELAVGELRDPKAAALPAIAALGGMAVPALMYLFIVGFSSPDASGWGVPMATDIAFSIGVLSLLGRRAPLSAKLFLLALAIADDVGAIAVIAVFYTADLEVGYLLAAAASLAFIWASNRVGIRSLAFYIAAAVVAWYLMLESGVHATIAGVALGLITPAHPLFDAEEFDRRARRIIDTYPSLVRSQTDREQVDHEARILSRLAKESIAPLNRLEHSLQMWSSYGIIPLFALANAGVRFEGTPITEALRTPVALGVGAGLFVGKIVGISGATWLAVRLGLGRMPVGVTWRLVFGLAALAGIGFTVALFVTGLAFEPGSPSIDLAKTGIFAGSLLAGLVGYVAIRTAPEPA